MGMDNEVKVPRLLTTRELSERTGLARWRLFELVAKGLGPRVMRVGNTLRFPEDGVVQWINEQSSQQERKE
jgi:predicted DNA-binding transcriptional regulator AlpA